MNTFNCWIKPLERGYSWGKIFGFVTIGRASQVAKWYGIRLSSRRSNFDPWAGKIPWTRKWKPQYSCLENPLDKRNPEEYSPWGWKMYETAKSKNFGDEKTSFKEGRFLKQHYEVNKIKKEMCQITCGKRRQRRRRNAVSSNKKTLKNNRYHKEIKLYSVVGLYNIHCGLLFCYG